MGSFFLLCDIYFDRLIQLMVDGDEIWEKLKSSIIIIIIIKLFYTYFSWYIAYYENVFFTVINLKCLVTRSHSGTTTPMDWNFTGHMW